MSNSVWVNSQRNKLQEFRQQQTFCLTQPIPIQQLFSQQVTCTDTIVKDLWRHLELDQLKLHLFALGGYGSSELYPYSDLDLLIIQEKELAEKDLTQVKNFISLLWDFGFIPKACLYYVNDYLNLINSELTLFTSALSLRGLVADKIIQENLQTNIQSQARLKTDFLQQRLIYREKELACYHQFSPKKAVNIKLHPGGLRDFHLITWLLQKSYQTKDWNHLVQLNLLTHENLKQLSADYQWLQRLRFGLHLVNNNDSNLLHEDSLFELANLLPEISLIEKFQLLTDTTQKRLKQLAQQF